MNLKDKYIEIAVNKLVEDNLTLCLYNGRTFIESNKRGVLPLLELINSHKDFSLFVSADKVIGKAAAHLYILLQIKDIYCFTISEPALEVFRKYEINVRYENLVSYIRNRNNDGYCPMESLVLEINNPEEALKLLIGANNYLKE